MRPKTDPQASIFDIFAEHNIGQELSAISDLLDQHPALHELVANDLIDPNLKPTGRKGFSAEQVLRFAILKQFTGYSFDELAFFLADSESFRTFARCWKKAPRRSTLQSLVSRVSAATWESINRYWVRMAREKGIESGHITRTDATVIEANIHEPSDSSLLWDCVRTIARHLQHGKRIFDCRLRWRNHQRAVKKLAHQIALGAQGKQLKHLYRKVICYTQRMQKALSSMVEHLKDQPSSAVLTKWLDKADDLSEITICVLSQTDQRIFLGESVPAKEKIYSIFEPHSDVIIKGRRAIQYGHKLNLTSGRSGLILDAVVEDGNPCDASTTLRMIKRQKDIFGQVPQQVSLDGGYASKENLKQAKEMGVIEVAFHKKRGLKEEDMVSSPTLYRKLRAFRAGIEANISSLKHNFNLKRCNWKGLARFKAYVWSSILAYNMFTLIRAG